MRSLLILQGNGSDVQSKTPPGANWRRFINSGRWAAHSISAGIIRLSAKHFKTGGVVMEKWAVVWKRIKAVGDVVATLRHLGWLCCSIGGIIAMIWYFKEWFGPVLAFGVVSANLLWAFVATWKLITSRKSRNKASLHSNISGQRDSGRDFFIGQWTLGCNALPTAPTFMATLRSDGSAQRGPPTGKGLPEVSGKWECLHGEARITWGDGWVDILRCVPGGVMKLAYSKPPFDPKRGLDNTAKATRA